MPNYITGVDPFLSNDFTEEDVLNLFISPSTTSFIVPEGNYDLEVVVVPTTFEGSPATQYEASPRFEDYIRTPMTPNDATPSPTNVIKARRRGGMRPESRIVHASVDIPKKKRDEFSEIERICKYPYKDKQIEF